MRHIAAHIGTIALIPRNLALGLDPACRTFGSTSLTPLPALFVAFLRHKSLLLCVGEIEFLGITAGQRQSHATIHTDGHLAQIGFLELGVGGPEGTFGQTDVPAQSPLIRSIFRLKAPVAA